MIAGTLLVVGQCGIRFGAGMRRGTIGLLSAEQPQLLPTFRHACRWRPPIVRLFVHHLRRRGFIVPEDLIDAEFDLYHGDMIQGGRGEILVRAATQ
jgi:formylmethanofuran dehydrogenase subunit C